ncbi:MAG: ABC transporter ATP-binding protein [Bacteroidetes bacterium]|nr:MAG: ABC transporter ATP-binding protein [Bacteroidota bacterium]
MEIIRLENISKIYQDHGIPVQALKDVNLEIDKGDFVVIAGPSGSGKTTLLNIIGSLDIPTEGHVFLERDNLTHKKKRELSAIRLRKIGFIFQAYNLLPVLTALENIEFSMMLLGLPDKERHKKAMKIMEELDIAELANKKPNKMSGGQQQRVAVARAIVNDPLLVLADEPTANLDTKTANGLLDLMQKMNEEKNITFVFSSHDKKVIDRAKKLFILKDGMIVNGN